MSTSTVPTDTGTRPRFAPDPHRIAAAIAKRSFATLATVSLRGRPHTAGVLYVLVGDQLYVSTDRSSRKARNVADNPHVAFAIPVRRLPVGPPSLIHFQATADIVAPDDPDIRALLGAGELQPIAGHGELERPDVCVLRITPARRLHTYGLGMSLLQLVRHPLDAAGSVAFPPG